jgi:hypothetical protein
MMATVTIHFYASRYSAECDAGSTLWFTRRLMSNDNDPDLHRRDNGAGIRLAGGRWQVFNRDRLNTVSIVELAALSAFDIVSGPAAHDVHCLSTMPPLLFGGEHDLADGSWLLAMNDNVARADVTGQPAWTADPSNGTDREQRTNDYGGMHRRPDNERHLELVGAYLADSDHRLGLAFHYREFLLGRLGAQEVDQGVTAALLLLSKGSIESFKRNLLKDKIWRKGYATPVDLRKYLLATEMLNVADVQQAQNVARSNLADGSAARYAQLYDVVLPLKL